LYAFSHGDAEKRKEAKRWIVSAFQGAFIVLFSHTFLYALDSGFVVFRARDLEEARRIEKADLEWTIKNVYFQTPLGLLAEDAGVNENARDKIYDVLDATDEAERQADAVVEGGFQLLDIIEIAIDKCEVGRACDCKEEVVYPYPPIPYAPHFPHPRPEGGLISPVDMERRFSMERPSGLQISIIERSLKEAEREMERIEDNKLRDELEEMFGRLRTLAERDPSTEDLREKRRKIESLFSKRESEIESLGTRKREALKKVVNTLPWADTGYGDTTYYAQFDPEWGDMLYGTMTFTDSACYGASVAMVVDTLLEGRTVDPVDIRNISRPYIQNGSVHGIVPNAARHYGLSYQVLETIEQVLAALDRGRMVIVTGGGMPHNMSRRGGHAYVLTGIDREKGIVYRSDPGHAYIQKLPIHEFKRSNFDFAHTIYTGGRGEGIKNFFASLVDSVKKSGAWESLRGSIGINEARASCCPPCIDISPTIRMKIAEINFFLSMFRSSLLQMIDTKYPLEQDMYHLYKTLMVKSLGSESVIPYTTLLLDRRHYEKEEIYFETYEETQEVGSHYLNLWYFWNWRQWLENITYKVRAGGEIREENDPATFYLESPRNDDTVKKAKELARRENWQRESTIPQYVWWYLDRVGGRSPVVCAECRYKEEIPPFLWWYIIERPRGIGPDEGRYPPCPCPENPPCPTERTRVTVERDDPLYVAREEIKGMIDNLSGEEGVKEVLAATDSLSGDLGLDELEELMGEEDASELLEEGAPADYLVCGMEIPVGETVELIREHLRKILYAIDDYLVEGVCFKERQEIMNRLAQRCSCECSTCTACDDPDQDCGSCYFTCDIEEIEDAHRDVLESRERLEEIRNRIAHLTSGYFERPTENICDDLNRDIRGEGESCRNITMHELVARKLHYSRAELDACGTRPEHLEDVVEGERTGKMPLFGPIVEKEDLPRETKTTKDGTQVNTSDFNWFCCSRGREEGN